jgi:hypothetical protein
MVMKDKWLQRVLHICLRMGVTWLLEWAWFTIHQAHSPKEVFIEWYNLPLVVAALLE